MKRKTYSWRMLIGKGAAAKVAHVEAKSFASAARKASKQTGIPLERAVYRVDAGGWANCSGYCLGTS